MTDDVCFANASNPAFLQIYRSQGSAQVVMMVALLIRITSAAIVTFLASPKQGNQELILE